MISFVYFDIGGVTIKDFSHSTKWAELRNEIGVTAKTEHIFDEVWNAHAPRYCLDYPVDSLLPEIRKRINPQLGADYSLLNAFVSRFEQNPSISPILKKLHSHCRIGLLTNMYVGMLDGIMKRNLLPDIVWDSIVDSSKVMAQKPNKDIYAIAEKMSGVPGSEILFIDNQEKHVKGAQAAGWNGYVYDSSTYEESSRKLEHYLRGLSLLSE